MQIRHSTSLLAGCLGAHTSDHESNPNPSSSVSERFPPPHKHQPLHIISQPYLRIAAMKFCTAVTLLATAGSAAAFVTNQQSDVKTALSASYLEQLAGPKTPHRPVQNSGISSYLDTVQTGSALQGGAGIGSYLDSVNSACNTIVPTDQCAEAISDYMSAAANGAAQPEANYVAAQTIGNYLDNLAGAAPTRQGGPGIQSYLSTVPTASSLAGGSGLHTYQDTVASNSAVSSSAGAVKGFLDALSSNGAVAPSAPAVKSYLQDGKKWIAHRFHVLSYANLIVR